MLKNKHPLASSLTIRMIEFFKQRRFAELPQISDEFSKLPSVHAVYFHNAALGYSLAANAIQPEQPDQKLSGVQKGRRDELLALAVQNIRESKQRSRKNFDHFQTDKDQAALQKLGEVQRLVGPVRPPLPSPSLRSRAMIR